MRIVFNTKVFKISFYQTFENILHPAYRMNSDEIFNCKTKCCKLHNMVLKFRNLFCDLI